jgi:carboxyl-terminal processing protease
MDNNAIVCKSCQSDNVIKYGKSGGVQLYYCKDCHTRFKDDDTLLHMETPAEHFADAAKAINETIRANHYNPAELDNETYRQIEGSVVALGETATSKVEFLKGFDDIWRKGPFSHVGLRLAEEPAAERNARSDSLIGGDDTVALTWEGNAAILTVNTMSGADTIKAINAAYKEIAACHADKLIIDLRNNGGGAFAVVPLIGHLLTEPIDAGVFVSRLWYTDHDTPPDRADFDAASPWQGYSVRAFHADALSRPLTSYRIGPMQPLFQGPVFVLTSARSISAADIAVDVLKSTSRATIIGEKTPGILLSANLFDIPGGFHLRVPIFDYYSIKNGRIEGCGITPDIETGADQALEIALKR